MIVGLSEDAAIRQCAEGAQIAPMTAPQTRWPIRLPMTLIINDFVFDATKPDPIIGFMVIPARSQGLNKNNIPSSASVPRNADAATRCSVHRQRSRLEHSLVQRNHVRIAYWIARAVIHTGAERRSAVEQTHKLVSPHYLLYIAIDESTSPRIQPNDLKDYNVKFLLCILLILNFGSAPLIARQQKVVDKSALADQVRTEFLHSWNAYKKYAWGEDGLKPISKKPYRWHSASLMITPLDAMDTMLLMGLTEEADSTREYIVRHLSFDHDFFVDSFEITIRLLGGLLSTYQMTGDTRLLAMAEDLGDRLLPIFRTPTGIPYSDVNLRTGEIRNPRTNPGRLWARRRERSFRTSRCSPPGKTSSRTGRASPFPCRW